MELRLGERERYLHVWMIQYRVAEPNRSEVAFPVGVKKLSMLGRGCSSNLV